MTYTYDTGKRMSTVTDWANRVTQYTYNSSSDITAIQFPKGTSRVMTYDANRRLLGRADYAANGTSIVSYQYTYDATGFVSSRMQPTASAVFAPSPTNFSFDAFTFKPATDTGDYDLYLWDAANGWELNMPIVANIPVTLPAGGVSEFLIWGVDLSQVDILTANNPYAFLTDLDMSSARGPADVYVTPVPEPSTLVLLGIGLAALLMWRRRRS